jgi:proline iminopeptidase
LKFLQNFFITIGFCSCVLTVHSQNPKNVNDNQKQLPGLAEWFLSTGNWESDPQLYVAEFGNGRETIVMVHGGWGGEHSGLINAVRGLEDQYHFIFYDQRGSLRSPCPDSLVTFNNHIEDLEMLRKELNLDKFTIIGHSMGAVLASAYATKYPQRIKSLILLAPARLKFPLPEEDKGLQHLGWEASQAFLNRAEVNQERDKYGLDRESLPLSSREETAKYRINLAKMMLYDITKWSLMTDGRAMFKSHLFPIVEATYPRSGWDYIQEFKKQEYQVSIMVGDHDFLDFKNHLIKKYANEVPRIKLSVIKNAGHLIWLDQPGIFKKKLLTLLNR